MTREWAYCMCVKMLFLHSSMQCQMNNNNDINNNNIADNVYGAVIMT